MAVLDYGQVLAIFMVLIVIFVSTWIFFRSSVSHCNSKMDLTGKTAIVTGANCGIGFFTALDLAKRNARVIMACRNQTKAEKAKEEIIGLSGNDNVVVVQLDVSLMKSVRKFVAEIKEEKRLDILVNNAGIISDGKSKVISEEGLETIYATNHLGPFLLTNLLLDLLIASAPSRIVNVSSTVNKIGKIELDNLDAEKSFNRHTRYFDTKLANILFTRELAKRLEGTGVTANVLHPGTVSTELLRNLPLILRVIIHTFLRIFFKTAEEGAQTSIHLAVSEEVEGISGKYFTECAVDEGGANPVSRDMDIANKLWEVSASLTGLDL